jgi:hypothetical protein
MRKERFMHKAKVVAKWHLLAAAVTTVFAMALYTSHSAKAQDKTKRTISLLHYHPSTATPPIKLHDLKIDGKTVNFSSMFEEGNKMLQKKVTPDAEIEVEDDFLEKMTFQVTNVFDKRATFIRFMVHLYTEEGVRKRSFDAAIPIYYGRPPGISYPWGINPEETESISIPVEMFPDIRRVVSDLGAKVIRVGVYANMVGFNDGSMWTTSGKIYPPK